ncbi:polysaccharide biosynthesis tyrosine autokinase [Dolichospermum sp. UHCC 0259]|uniref:GumC family protein n=1 Tax=Dolichospermum sp. UHCC 0259 TaxID=2590010 RepID=UPI0014481B5D|nr:polysaccharide biosynthesis tyrosine autokinase [Dolichospermum sp. UHCC 0259]MTJ48418.1 polysaccharide biosynthesis tyrosine autokinase [Dolichospermum sp. UHCC 0259]
MSKSSIESREATDLDFGRYLLMVKRQWLPATSVFIATVILSAIATNFMKPSYEAEGKLLFKLPSFQVLGSNLLTGGSEGGSGELKPLVSTQNPINTEIEIIYSPAVLQQTINRLKLKNKNKKGELVKVKDLEKAITIKVIGGTDVVKIAYQSPNPKEAAAVVNTVMKLYVENNILTTRGEAEATYKFMARQLPQVQSAVHLTEVALRKFKQENNIVDLTEETRSTVAIMGNLDNEINNVQAQLEDINAQTNALRQKIDLDSQQAIAVSSLNNSPAVQGILTQLQDIDRQLAVERSRYFDDNPVITSLEAKKANLNNLLQTQIQETIGDSTQVPEGQLQIGAIRQQLIQSFLQAEVQRFGLSKKLASLYNSRTEVKRRAKIIPMLVQNQRDLERKVEVAQSTYETILKKAQELQVAQNKNTAIARIISQAEIPKKPLVTKKIIVVLLGVLLGAFFASTTIILMEMRDRTVKTIQEVRDIFKYTFLGIVPSPQKKAKNRNQQKEEPVEEIIVRDAPYSLESEMYRMIQANLRLLSSDKLLNTIVVTSTVAKEGKSTVTANLSAVLAQLGYRVLLVDADMRIPSQNHLWQVNSIVGLSEVLVSQAEFKVAVCTVMDNLDILTAGIRPPNPLALLNSQRMESLITEFSAQYDFVIIEAPPLLVGADALTLSKMTDGMLLVANPDVLDLKSAISAQEILNNSKCNVLGLLVNSSSDQDKPKNNYLYNFEDSLKNQALNNPFLSIWEKIK